MTARSTVSLGRSSTDATVAMPSTFSPSRLVANTGPAYPAANTL